MEAYDYYLKSKQKIWRWNEKETLIDLKWNTANERNVILELLNQSEKLFLKQIGVFRNKYKLFSFSSQFGQISDFMLIFF